LSNRVSASLLVERACDDVNPRELSV